MGGETPLQTKGVLILDQRYLKNENDKLRLNCMDGNILIYWDVPKIRPNTNFNQ